MMNAIKKLFAKKSEVHATKPISKESTEYWNAMCERIERRNRELGLKN